MPVTAPADGGARSRLLARYRALVLEDLPRRARAERWVVTADHCFGRIVLDHAVGGPWYDVIGRGRAPASTRLDDAALERAVALAERIGAEGDGLLRAMDAQSLAWRGKPPKAHVDGAAQQAGGWAEDGAPATRTGPLE